MNRRNSTRAASGGALSLDATLSISHVVTESCSPIPGSLGVLYDSTLYVGCQACVTECRDISFLACNPEGEQTWPDNDKPSPYTNNVIQVWRSGTGVSKDQEENGYAYVKEQCMHCIDSNCVSVYLVSALKKDPRTGIVHHDKDVCMGCRYCVVACSYSMLKYDYNNPLSALHKCGLCNQKGVERLDKGGLPGCAEVRSVGVVISDTREKPIVEAEKRLVLKLGSEYHYSCQTVRADGTYLHTVSKYYPHLYDEREGGGIQVTILTGVPYEDLDLPELDDLSTGARFEHAQHFLCKGMIPPPATLAGLTVLVRRNTKNDHHDRRDDYES